MNIDKLKKQLKIKFGDPALDYSGHKTTWYVKDNVRIDDIISFIVEALNNKGREHFNPELNKKGVTNE